MGKYCDHCCTILCFGVNIILVYWRVSKVSELFCDGPNQRSSLPTNILKLEGSPQLINMDHTNIYYVVGSWFLGFFSFLSLYFKHSRLLIALYGMDVLGCGFF